MLCSPRQFKVDDLVKAWKSSSLRINSEYQRGATWKETQKQGLIDSLFRLYPLPPVFLHQITESGLGGNDVVRFEVVDGQQRIRAFADYFEGKFSLLKHDDTRLRLPNSLRQIPASWGGRLYSQLDSGQRNLLNESLLDAFVITEANADEIRDLFIRLQSGTALNRQQLRDAWPGRLGPFIESLAGKLDREPSIQLFGLIDKRSDKGNDDIDNFTVNRQVCAQLLTLFLARTRDALTNQDVAANDLDQLYHSNTEFDPSGPSAGAFKKCLDLTAQIFRLASEAVKKSERNKSKYKKMDVLAVFFFVQDRSRDPHFKFDSRSLNAVAAHVVNGAKPVVPGKSISGRAIAAYYADWSRGLPEAIGIRLDPRRLFDESQKALIEARDLGRCQICGNEVADNDAEYDHYPLAHYLGGRTETDNGRLVCSTCHPRGRPAMTILEE